MRTAESKAYTVNNRRGGNNPEQREACRVCGSPQVHTRAYNDPTTKCIEYFKKELAKEMFDGAKRQADARRAGLMEASEIASKQTRQDAKGDDIATAFNDGVEAVKDAIERAAEESERGK